MAAKHFQSPEAKSTKLVIPIILIYRKLRLRYKALTVSGFIILPMIAGMLYSHRFLNGLLEKGWLPHTHIPGTPDAVLLHTGLMLILLGFTYQALRRPPFTSKATEN
ncbi:hypothetical protein [Chitinophaga deserti]|uniref:hypothetical protein n=1 Tax=Chitinophaga deserti TaxID=2164099 RepID=UPI000D6D2599|nr:hypothetical protein [Chitinophaga deserti]